MNLDPRTVLITLTGVLLAIALQRARGFVIEWFSKALDWLFWNLSRRMQRGFARRLSLRRYCTTQLSGTTSKHLELPGAFSKKLETDKAFVPLLLDEGRGGDLAFSHSTVLDAGQRIRVVGDPGSGKSSLIKRIHRDACQSALESPKTARLPIRIELKTFLPPQDLKGEAALADWAVQGLRDVVTEVPGFDMEACFDSYVSDAGILVLLDGLDEVPASAYPRTAEAIRALSRRLEQLSAKTIVVLTMRSQFHVQVAADFTSTFPRALHIRPLSTNDIFLFLTRWPYDQNVDVTTQVNRIYGDLTDRPTLREMCTNPLVLAMYVATDERVGHTAELPETRAQFYSHVVQELLIVRRSRQVGTPSARTAIRRERESILGRMAFEHLSNSDEPANALSWERAVQIASEVLQDNNRDAIEAYLRTMAKETGLFTEERMSETIRFIHLTFCEFFAAFEAVNGLANGWSQVLERHRSFLQSEHPQVRTRMIEVVPFAAGLLPSNRVHNGMTDIAGLAQPEVFIRCVLETQLYGHETWQRFARDEIDALTLTAPDAWDERWLTRLQLFSVALTEGERWADLTGRPPAARSEELYSELVGTDEQRLVRLFASFATQDAAASFRLAEACGVDLLASRADLLVDACAEPPFLALALERVEREPEQLGWTSVLAEASLRYEVVAATLRTFQPVSSWRAAALALPARRRWPRDLANTSNLASVALTLAIDAEREKPSTPFVFVRLLGFLSSFRIFPVLLSALAFAIIAGCALWISGQIRVSAGWQGAPLVVGALTYAILFGAVLVRLSQRLLYRRLTNAGALRPRDGSQHSPASDTPLSIGFLGLVAQITGSDAPNLESGRLMRRWFKREFAIVGLHDALRGMIGQPGLDPVTYEIEHHRVPREVFQVIRPGEWGLHCAAGQSDPSIEFPSAEGDATHEPRTTNLTGPVAD